MHMHFKSFVYSVRLSSRKIEPIYTSYDLNVPLSPDIEKLKSIKIKIKSIAKIKN